MVMCTIAEMHWGWPLAAISSVLYFFLFWSQRLYGDAMLQVFFAVLAVWGWTMWLRGIDGAPLPITRLNHRQQWHMALIGAALWLVTGVTLLNFTDTDVPWWDAFPTAISLIGQYLLAHKRLENWTAWIIVNTVAVGLFAWKALWLTTLLYVVFIALSVMGWRRWSATMKANNA